MFKILITRNFPPFYQRKFHVKMCVFGLLHFFSERCVGACSTFLHVGPTVLTCIPASLSDTDVTLPCLPSSDVTEQPFCKLFQVVKTYVNRLFGVLDSFINDTLDAVSTGFFRSPCRPEAMTSAV